MGEETKQVATTGLEAHAQRSPPMNGQRSALGILLDATELMIARDVSQGRNAEEMRRALDAAHAALTHIATAVGLTPPTDLEKLKAAVTDFVVTRAAAPAPTAKPVDLLAIAREWFGEHPYESDVLNDEAILYFDSFQGVAPPASTGDRMLARVMRAVLNGQGAAELEDETQVRLVVAKLVGDASLHRSKRGESLEIATLERKLAELETKHGALIAEFEKQVAKKGRRR